MLLLTALTQNNDYSHTKNEEKTMATINLTYKPNAKPNADQQAEHCVRSCSMGDDFSKRLDHQCGGLGC